MTCTDLLSLGRCSARAEESSHGFFHGTTQTYQLFDNGFYNKYDHKECSSYARLHNVAGVHAKTCLPPI